ncbi:MAG: phosphodiester glycosidase family protein [Defluviitaleaceae bacterium]|nr:phosphodiester glycosidase family protein [Defluviitaleaceae bacterium]
MFSFLKRFVAISLILILIPIHIQTISASQIFYEVRQETRLSRNTYLHEIVRITPAGLVRFSVLTIPLNDPYLHVDVFNSQVEMGLKQPLTTLLNANGAFAGVNGDFFGLAGRHSVPLGFEMIGGEISAQDAVNAAGNTSASFMMGYGGAFIDYVRPTVNLLLNGERPFTVGLVNMVTDLSFPSFLTRGYTTSTAALDERIGRSYKLIVENNIITDITYFTTEVPYNGFVVIMNPQTYNANAHHFYIGQNAQMDITANIDLNAIHTAISGENRILHYGQIPDIATTRSTARHPRTVMGLNAAGDRLILMTIDGRGDSVGASLSEAAGMMREFGAHHAINLDGGGSTTMAANLPMAAGGVGLINTPSEGSQRAIINSIGVVDNSAPSYTISHLEIIAGNNAPVGVATPFNIKAFDAFMNPIPFDMSAAEISVSNGDMTDAGLVTRARGSVMVQVRYGEIATAGIFNGIDIVQISIYGDIGSQMTFIGHDNYGRSAVLSPASLNFLVNPPNLGHVYNGAFVPQGIGLGWLQVRAGAARAYAPLNLYRQRMNDEGYSHTLNYSFAQSVAPQMAQIELPAAHTAYVWQYALAVYGNNSGHALRGNIVDAQGNTFAISFGEINTYGWQDLRADVPTEAAQPVRMTHIYVLSHHQNTTQDYTLRLYNLRAQGRNDGTVVLPPDTRAADSLRRWYFEAFLPGEHDIVISEISAELYSTHVIAYAENYSVLTTSDLLIVQMDAGTNSFTSSGAAQWGRMNEHLQTTTARNIVIHSNLSPLNFRNNTESQLFHDMMSQMADNGRNIFVVSHDGSRPASIQLIDGVRYINLPYIHGDDYTYSHFAVLRLRLGGVQGLHYTMEWLFDSGN